MTEIDLWTPPASAIPIWGETTPGYQPEFGQPVPTLTPYLVNSGAQTGAVIIFPGGGYSIKAAHEAGPVAEWLNSLGISAFVLDYRVAPYRHPMPMLDARRAVQLVRCRAAEWAVDPEKIAVLGFSAGGHLASTTGTHFEAVDGLDLPQDVISAQSFIPNALVLCYPVISFTMFGHRGSGENLCGPDAPEELVESLCNDQQVTAQTPPTFLWHTASDAGVPVQNSLYFADALSQAGVPFALHVFPEGEHGLGLAFDHPSAGPWTDLCGRWLKNMGY